MTNSSSPEPVDLSDPSISAHRLQELAQTHPQQWEEILAHPNVYPGLTDWIRDRQAELAATGGAEPDDESAVAAQDAVDEAAAAEAGSPVDSPLDETTVVGTPTEASYDAPSETSAGENAPDEPAADAQSTWAFPDASKEEDQDTPPATGSSAASWTTEQPQESAAQPTESPQDHQPWGWSQPTGQQQFGQYGQQPSAQQQFGYQQPGYGQPQQFAQPQQFGQQQQFTNRRGASRIDLNSSRTWGLFIAGGAAFLSLFGFIFSPALQYNVPFASHLGSGGWLILLMFMATVALSLLQLLKPSAWMRFFFIAVSFGASFMMLGRAMTLVGFFTMRSTSFSVLYLMFMSLVLLAGVLIYLAPKTSDDGQQNTPTAGQQGYNNPGQQYGPQPGYGQQAPEYPNYPSGQPPYGGYSQGGGYPQGGPQQ